jgi:hypothetical protein
MTTALDITAIAFKLRGLFQKTDEENPGEQEIDLSFLDSLANGTAADQADQIWIKERTIAGSSNDDLDLEGGLTDIFGTAINPARVKGLIIMPAAANAGPITVGNAAANGAALFFGAVTHTVSVRAGGLFVNYAPETGWTTIAGTGDILRIANPNGSSVTYKIGLIMASA